MCYNVDVGRADNLLNMLSSNSMARSEHQRVHGGSDYLRSGLVQSFGSAANAFRAIEAPTRGIIVPYGGGEGEGQDIITKLCGSFDPHKDVALLRKAQQYSVNIYPHVLRKLQGVIHEVQKETDIWYLSAQHYSPEFGLSEAPVKKLDLTEG
jgi:CRISPR-associated endonuclease/helicase Cas3